MLFDLAAEAKDLIAAGVASHAALRSCTRRSASSDSRRASVAERVVATLSEKTHTIANVTYKIERRGEAHVSEEAIARLRARVGDVVPAGSVPPPEAVDAVVEARFRAKSDKNFALADALREALAEAGVVLTDSKEGTTWSAGG